MGASRLSARNIDSSSSGVYRVMFHQPTFVMIKRVGEVSAAFICRTNRAIDVAFPSPIFDEPRSGLSSRKL